MTDSARPSVRVGDHEYTVERQVVCRKALELLWAPRFPPIEDVLQRNDEVCIWGCERGGILVNPSFIERDEIIVTLVERQDKWFQGSLFFGGLRWAESIYNPGRLPEIQHVVPGGQESEALMAAYSARLKNVEVEE